MWFHLREIAGWILVLGALYLLSLAVEFLKNPETPQIAEAGVTVFAALGVLRMGILLIRISTAARIVLAEIAHDRTIDLDR